LHLDMNTADIVSMFCDIDDITKEFTAKEEKIKKVLSISMGQLMEYMNTKSGGCEMCPRSHLVFNAFRLTSIENIKVVLIGQDPYVNVDEAMGLSFSVPRGVKIPPSLRNIYGCLKHYGAVGDIDHGDLSNWARQGVLLLNCS